ncbi:Hypothetical predicted protein [Marmota monax]|uniref:Uncharacterized protein n=1 Tax=Marmota monax TaxID=9995 RepID=A0A5E4ATB5_MARMO|nr:Hypothetical predicted protein [Marmota monax]
MGLLEGQEVTRKPGGAAQEQLCNQGRGSTPDPELRPGAPAGALTLAAAATAPASCARPSHPRKTRCNPPAVATTATALSSVPAPLANSACAQGSPPPPGAGFYQQLCHSHSLEDPAPGFTCYYTPK